MKIWFYLWASLSLTMAAEVDEQYVARRPNFGVILNDDGDLSFVDPDPEKAAQMLRANVESHAALGIGTLVYCIGSGSDVLNYPTEIASSVGWRKTREEDAVKSWRPRLENARAAMAAGLDAVRIAGEEARKNGIRYLPSLRMNDSHFIFDPFNYPLTGEFWLKNHAKLRIGDSPVTFRAGYENLFDYTHPEVRTFRLAVIDEVLTRNEDIVDGFELDFNRTQVFFPKGKAEAGAPLMTDLVRQVRQMLDKLERKVGRPMSLFVRIPPSLSACRLAGLEVEKWMDEGLVDLVTPAQLMTLAHDMPIRDLIARAHERGVQVYPSLYPRNSWRAPLDLTLPDYGLSARIDRAAVKAEILGAAANYRAMGADGFYLFNFYGLDVGERPHPDWMHGLVAALRYNRPDGSPKTFAVTKTYYYDDVEPSYAYVKQLPASVTGARDFTIEVGDLPGDSPFPLAVCLLRLGLKNVTDSPPPVSLNGSPLAAWKSVTATVAKKSPPDAAAYTVLYKVDPKLLQRGANSITVQGDKLPVTDLEIAFAYRNQLSRLLFRTYAPAASEKEEKPTDE